MLAPFARLSVAVLCLAAAPHALHAASTVVISEFMAENNGFHFDEDGDSPDWIELKNESGAAVDLAGWHLTDEATNLTKWTFPPVALAPNAYLVVFASGKDRAVAGAELHTNFQLNNQGEYLALVEPDGTTIAREYSPAFPPQRSNVSFGTERNVITTRFVETGDTARYFIPNDGSVDGLWTDPDFDDSAWPTGPTGLGFDRSNEGGGSGGNAGGAVILSVDFNHSSDGEVGAANTELGFDTMTLASNPATFNGITVNLTAIGGATLDQRDRATPVDSPPAFTQDQLYDDFIFANGTSDGNGARIEISGLSPNTDYGLTIWSFDSSSSGGRVSDWIEIASGTTTTIATAYQFDGSILPTLDGHDTIVGNVRSSPSGQLIIEGRRHGGTSHGVFMNALQLAQLDLGGAIATDVEGAMADQNATAYLRLPFQVDDPSAVQTLDLRVKYDDGFIAYLNGQEVASRHAPEAASWNAAATAEHPNAEALVFETFVVNDVSGLLRAGQNVLAIHGLNVTAGDDDFLIVPELDGADITEEAGLYLKPPTPGAANSAGFPGFVADTTFTMDRGFYESPFMVEIACDTANAEIRWTLDGSEPTATTGNVYTGPIAIDGTSFLRAAAFFPGLIPSDVDTHTYIFLDQVLQQSNVQPGYPTVWQAGYPADYEVDPNIVNDPAYGPTLKDDLRSLPTLSIVADHEELWGGGGIYNNATSGGIQWERAASVELFNPDGTTEFAVNCGLRMQGNASRDNVRTPKHNFRLLFKSIYGPSKLSHDWFGGGVDRFDNIVLRACFTDSWATRFSPGTPLGARYRPEDATYLRDIWMKDTLADMGNLSGRGNHVHLYVNGLYWGLYNPTERLDASFFEEHVGGHEGSWDVIRDFSEVLDGSKSDWDTMMALVNSGIGAEAKFEQVSELVDVENLIDYMLLHFFGEAEDWPHHNWYAAHRRATNGVPATKWIFLSWDQEIIADQDNVRDLTDVNNNDTPARIYSQLRASAEFRRLFGDRAQKHLFNGGALTASNSVARFQNRMDDVFRAMVGESARWGDTREFPTPGTSATGLTFTRDEYWVPEIELLLNGWFPNQVGVTLARLRADGLYPNVDAPLVSPFGGAVESGFELALAHGNAGGTIYFTTDGTDPRVYGSGAVAPGAQPYGEPIVIDSPTLLRARVFFNNQWSALVAADFFPPQDFNALALTEIMYNPPDFGVIAGDELEFLELKNVGSETLDLTGLQFTDGVSFTFAPGTMLAPGAFFVLGRNEAALGMRYPGLTVDGVFEGLLDNAGEQITIRHPVGTRLLTADYNDAGRWPSTPDGFGFSLVPRQPETQPNLSSPQHWRASSHPGGSPGADDPAPSTSEVIINEVLTHTDLPQVDAIELFNPGPGGADIGGWWLSDDRRVPHKFRIPNGTVLPAGGYEVFTEADFNPSPATDENFNLSSEGEEVYLFSADPGGDLTGYSDGFNFGAAANGVSFGRYVISTGEEHYPAQSGLTLDGANAAPLVGPVVICRIMYHPPDLAGGVDNTAGEYIVLENISGQTVALSDGFGNSWGVRDAVNYEFPLGAEMAPGGRAVVVSFDPANAAARNAFEATYPDLAGLPLFGPYTGKLDNSNERVELFRPDAPNTMTGFVPEILVERVHYRDAFPWDAGADGTGGALHRLSATGYGNDPTNWVARSELTIFTQPMSRSGFPGDTVTLLVTAAGDGPLAYQWYLDGSPLAGANGDTLILADIQEADRGSYTVEVSDSTGSLLSQPAFVEILVDVTIVVQPQAQSVVAGGTVTFSVVTAGTLPVQYRWLRLPTPVLTETTFSHSSFLTVTNAQPSDAGFYRVGVSNAVRGLELGAALVQLTVLSDADGDGQPDTWETMHGFDLDDPTDASLDADGDGATNREEYEAGTDPNDPESVFVVSRILTGAEGISLEFEAMAKHTYSVLQSDALGGPNWIKVMEVPGYPADTNVTLTLPASPQGGVFYQIQTPRLP